MRIATVALAALLAFGAAGVPAGASAGEEHPGWAVFIADKKRDNVEELYAARLDGGAVVQLSGPLREDGYVDTFRVSPDKRHVAYIAGEKDATGFALYVNAVEGGAHRRLSAASGRVKAVWWAPDAERLAYEIEQSDGVGLYTVRRDGTARAHLATFSNTPHTYLSWSPDSARLAFRSESDDPVGRGSLQLLRADGSERKRVAGGGMGRGNVATFAWSPDGRWLAVLVDAEVRDRLELYLLPVEAPERMRKLSGTLPEGGDVVALAWAPVGGRLAYLADQDMNNRYELYVVRPERKVAPQRLSAPMALRQEVLDFVWSPDGSRLAYAAGELGVGDLFTVKADGSEPTPVSQANQPFRIGGFNWSPDGVYLAYMGDEEFPNRMQLYVVRPDGSGHRRISGAEAGRFGVEDFLWSPDGKRLAYLVHHLANLEHVPLYAVELDTGAEPRAITEDRLKGYVQLGFKWSPDGRHVIYVADQDLSGRIELYAAEPTSGRRRTLSGEMAPGAGVYPRPYFVIVP